MIYLISFYNESGLIDTMDYEDSLGALWLALSSLTENVLSPFAFQAITSIKSNKTSPQ